MRKLSLVLTIVILLGALIVSACNKPEPPAENPINLPAEKEVYVVGKNEFRLSALPELDKHEPITEIYERYYPEYTDHLIPSNDYGELYYFVGKQLMGEYYMTGSRYGLCDAAGRIVVDPIYESAYIVTYGGYEYLSLHLPVTKEAVEAVSDGEFDYWSIPESPTILAARDGSWVLEDIQGYVYGGDEHALVVIGHYDGESEYRTNYIYSPKGELLATLPMTTVFDYYDGMLIVGEPSGDSGTTNMRVVDIHGNYYQNFGAFNWMYAFHDGIAVVENKDGTRALINKEGEFINDIRYEALWYYPEHQMYEYSIAGQEAGILDSTGEPVVSFSNALGSFRYFFGGYTEDEFGTVIRVENSNINSVYFMEVNSGLESPVYSLTDVWPNYMKNGWYSVQDSNTGTFLLRNLSDEDLEYSFDNGHWCELTRPENNLAVISSGQEEEDGYHDYITLFDLTAGEEIITIEGLNGSVLEKNGCFLVYSWVGYFSRSQLYDFSGNLLFKNKYNSLSELGEGLFSVTTDIYGGIIDINENWLLRLSIKTTD